MRRALTLILFVLLALSGGPLRAHAPLSTGSSRTAIDLGKRGDELATTPRVRGVQVASHIGVPKGLPPRMGIWVSRGPRETSLAAELSDPRIRVVDHRSVIRRFRLWTSSSEAPGSPARIA